MAPTPEQERLLVPELADWGDTCIESWVTMSVSPSQLVGAVHVLWPSFVEHDDCVFIETGFTEEGYQRWMTSTRGNKTSVEAVMNHTHICDLFQTPPAPPTRDQVLYLGTMMAAMLSAKLRAEFPLRTFVVSFPTEHMDDLLNYEVTFFQQR